MFKWQLTQMRRKRPIFLRHRRIGTRCFGIRLGFAKWDLRHALYCTCVAVAKGFLHLCTVCTVSWHLPGLEHHVDAMLQKICPIGLAMFCGDISESMNPTDARNNFESRCILQPAACKEGIPRRKAV